MLSLAGSINLRKNLQKTYLFIHIDIYHNNLISKKLNLYLYIFGYEPSKENDT